LRFFYTKETVMSPKAKAEFVPPDLIPFPKSKKNLHIQK
jgi:hypothetical protein